MEKDNLSVLLEEHGVIAADSVMRGLFQKAAYLAKMDATVLLSGESGVGKDWMAKFIHHVGPRRDEPFIHVNCSAVPQELFESELFGYESGTFTGGLTAGKQGLLEAAQGGTLFLDEIGEMSLSNQVKLLDFLQNKQVTRLGGGGRKNARRRETCAARRCWSAIPPVPTRATRPARPATRSPSGSCTATRPATARRLRLWRMILRAWRSTG